MDVLALAIDGVDGECTLDGYEDQITCLSFGHGVSNALQTDVSNIGRARGRVDHSDFTITKYLDKATPLLNYKCCIGANLGTITFTVLRAAGESAHTPMITYTMDNAMVAAASVSGGGGQTPIESVSFNYTKIRWEYAVQSTDMQASGSVAAEWDVTVNTGAPS